MTSGVRTYHARRGRTGPAAMAALERLLPTYGVEPHGQPLDVGTLFEPVLPVVLEIGFGKGTSTLALARRERDVGVLAADVHTPGIAAILSACESEQLANVRVVAGDAVTLLRERIPPGSLSGIRAFFPDPWPKARHAKRRLIQPDLVRMMVDRLRSGAVLHTATDQCDYAAGMLAVLRAEPRLVNCFDGYAPRPAWRPVTEFEAKALEQGADIRELMFQRI